MAFRVVSLGSPGAPSGGRGIQFEGVDQASRAKVDYGAGPNAWDDGTVLHIYAPDIVLDLKAFCAKNGHVYDNTGNTSAGSDNYAGLRAAIDHLATFPAIPDPDRGRRVFIGVGTINCRTPIRTVPMDIGILGAGRAISKITFKLDSANTCLDPAAPGGDVGFSFTYNAARGVPMCVMEGIALEGVHGLEALVGVTPDPPRQYGTGVRIYPNMNVRDLDIGGFCFGLDARIQHTYIYNVSAGGNWAGLYAGPREPTAGDGAIDHCSFVGNSWTAVAMHPTHFLGGLQVRGGHWGQCAYGAWKMSDTRRWPTYGSTQAATADGNGTTVAVTNGSKVVTGTGTTWKTGTNKVIVGALLNVTADGTAVDQFYQVDTVDSNTQITLAYPYKGSTKAAQGYELRDGVDLSILMLSDVIFTEQAFEGCGSGLFVHEDGNGVIGDCVFTGCSTTACGTSTGAFTNPIATDMVRVGAITGTRVVGGTTLFGGTDMQVTNAPIVTKAGFGLSDDNDFGDVTVTNNRCNALGVPFMRTMDTGSGTTGHGNVGTESGYPLNLVNIKSGVVHPGEVVMVDTTTDGQRGSIHANAVRGILGVARTIGIGGYCSSFVMPASPVNPITEINIAPTAILAADAASGQSVVTFLTTRPLGATAAPVTFTDGTTSWSGTVTNATTVTLGTALGAKIPKATQVWVARTPGAQVAANRWLKPRYGATGAGTTQTDEGQVIGATNWLDTDTPVFGQSITADDGKRVLALLAR